MNAAKQMERWLQRHPMVPDALFVAGYHLWLSCLVSHRNDNKNNPCQREHNLKVRAFKEAAGTK